MKRTAPRQTKNHLGQRLCRMPTCLQIVPKRFRSYCSKECRENFQIAYFPNYARSAVWNRDQGFCAKCGCDTKLLHRILAKFGELTTWQEKNAITRELGFNDGSMWQADHIQECANGGWGIENFRTLCTPCHKAETARLARELAERRRIEKQSIGESLFPKAGAA